MGMVDPTTVDPMPDPGAELLDDIRTFLARFVAYPTDHAVIAHTLWIAHTHLMDCWESTPRIAFLSPEPASGKSRALEVTEPLVPRPVHAVNTTPAYLFRKVSDPNGLPTILYDEIDTVFGEKANGNEDIRGMLNAGHRNGAVAGRCVVRGKIVETEELPAYCAVAMAGLNDLPDTIMTRAVVVRMQRRSPLEKVEPWRRRINAPDADKLRERLDAWTGAVRDRAIDYWPVMPESIEDRDADAWEALLSVADLAGGHWPETARVAAVAAVADSMRNTESLGIVLLRDLRTVFSKEGAEHLVTASALTNLRGIEESPWDSINRDGSALNARGLARRLRRYGIKSGNIRDDDGKVLKGYLRAHFVDAWIRYLPDDDQDDSKPEGDNDPSGDDPAPQSPRKSATSATSATSQVNTHEHVAPVADYIDEPDETELCWCGYPPPLGRTQHFDCERVAGNGHGATDREPDFPQLEDDLFTVTESDIA